ncbi:HEAT repeat domain-containing protein [Mycolicibacterium elephantis]|uniref:HEAT repeat domain-containing protein n=1 Tax=Mycolicibacterium elephantis TaxID=81858 RepID=UPI000AC331DA|nr:HEAT repeat domain-containing protein [Mycolicibacterium elephantis]
MASTKGKVSATTDFDYEIRLCSSFDDALWISGSPTDIAGLVNVGFERGRILLQAPGGSGKSYTLRRIADTDFARPNGLEVVLIDLGSYGLDMLRMAVETSFEFELGELLLGGEPILLLVDGLNEIPRLFSEKVLDVVDNRAYNNPNLAVVVADRLIRRSIDLDRWVLATLAPVTREKVKAALGVSSITDEDYQFLQSPANLRYSLALRTPSASRSGNYLEFLQGHDLRPLDIQALSDFAYEAYKDSVETGQTRVFKLDALRKLNRELLSRTLDAGIITRLDNGHGRFIHHLMHDFLAARSVSANPRLWSPRVFNILTLNRSTFDSLSMLFEQCAEKDRLIRAIQNWDLYAAAYILFGVSGLDEGHWLRSTEYQILSMIGERVFDWFESSAVMASDALKLYSRKPSTGVYASELLNSPSLTETVALARQRMEKREDCGAWLSVFARDVPLELLVEYIESDDGTIGWTAANALRRNFPTSLIPNLVRHCASRRPAVRWRAVHVLGATASGEVEDALFDRLSSDPHDTVLYGALRSIIEHAGRIGSREHRKRVLDRLAENAAIIFTRPGLARQFERCAPLSPDRPYPPGWANDVGSVIEELLILSTTITEQDRWRSLSARLRANERRRADADVVAAM